jgi:hypothetical protein
MQSDSLRGYIKLKTINHTIIYLENKTYLVRCIPKFKALTWSLSSLCNFLSVCDSVCCTTVGCLHCSSMLFLYACVALWDHSNNIVELFDTSLSVLQHHWIALSRICSGSWGLSGPYTLSMKVVITNMVQDMQQWLLVLPGKSLHLLLQEIGLSYPSCQKLARRERIHQYCVTVVPQPPDMEKRVAHCQWFQTSVAQNLNIWDMTLFSNKALFHLSQYVSYKIHTLTLHPQKVELWCAVLCYISA